MSHDIAFRALQDAASVLEGETSFVMTLYIHLCQRRAGGVGSLLLASLLLCWLPCAVQAQSNAIRPVKVILDTDIGDDIDDAYALALVVSLPNVKLLGVTTTYGQTRERAQLAAKLLQVMGRADVPVYPGRRGTATIGRQYAWARGFHSGALKQEPAVTFLKRMIDRWPGEITLIGIGPLVNYGDLVTQYPEVRSKIKRFVLMGGAVYVGYNNQPPPTPEWNIRADPQAARAVFGSGTPLVMAGLEVTTMMHLDSERQKRLFATGTPMTDALAALTSLWGGSVPTLYDPVAVAAACGYLFCDTEPQHVDVSESGLTTIGAGTPDVTVLVHPRADAFLDWYVNMLTQNSGPSRH